jgi:hypothetical protein
MDEAMDQHDQMDQVQSSRVSPISSSSTFVLKLTKIQWRIRFLYLLRVGLLVRIHTTHQPFSLEVGALRAVWHWTELAYSRR